ncbi:MAG: response regulator transcription factor [Lachnospiraceae bacterium]|nr:response regulator transcription factor [Lachnospiraceae bacterium]
MPKLLLVDDDTEVLAVNKRYFEQDGFLIRTAASAEDAYRVLNEFKPDCILLDVMMPGTDGFEACAKIKQLSGGAPVIFLTGRVSEDDKVEGLMLGADDYIEKPYSLKELKARVTVQLRKKVAVAPKPSNILSVPPLKIDILAHKTYYGDTEIPLSNREYDLLHLLADKKNTVVSFEEIGTAFFGIYSDADRRTVMVTASRMRKKLEDYTGLDNIIETVYSKGYVLRTK